MKYSDNFLLKLENQMNRESNYASKPLRGRKHGMVEFKIYLQIFLSWRL